ILSVYLFSLVGFAQTWEELNREGEKLYKENKFKEAVIFFEKAKIQAEKSNGKLHQHYALTCYNLAEALRVQNMYDKAEPLYIESKNIREKILGKQHPDYAKSCNALGILYKIMGMYDKAESLYIEAKEIREKVLGKESADYASSCNNLAILYKDQGLYIKAEPLYIEAKNIRESVLGKEHPLYAQSCNNLAVFYMMQNIYIKAEPLYIEAKNIREKAFGKEHPDYAQSCNNLGILYANQSLYTKAGSYFMEAKEIKQKLFGKENLDYAQTCNNLGLLYSTQGFFSKAEPLYLEAKAIIEKIQGKTHIEYAQVCNNLALLYTTQGFYQKAELLYIDVKEIFAKKFGKKNPDYALVCTNLGMLYANQGLAEKAAPLYLEAKEVYSITLGKKHSDYARACNNLALLYSNESKFKEAETLFTESYEVYAMSLGKKHSDYALVCNNMASLYANMGLFEKAESLYIEAKNIRAETLGKKHIDYASSCRNLAELYFLYQNKYEEAEPLLKEASEILIEQTESNFINLSEKERGQFWTTFQYNFDVYNSFVLQSQKKELASWLFDNQLVTKGLLFKSTQKMQNIIKRNNDPVLQKLFEDWRNQREYVAYIVQLNAEQKQKQQINEAEEKEKANQLEKKLSLQSATFANELDKKHYYWRDVQKKLKRGEVLVEIIRTHYYRKQNSDSSLYMALLLEKNSSYPEILVLGDAKYLEDNALPYYQNSIRAKKLDKNSYQAFWKPLQKKLGKAKKIYVSPDGIFYQINLQALYNSENKKYLGDIADIVLLSSSRDLLALKTKKEREKQLQDYQLHLFGYPDYSGEKQKNKEENKERNTEVWIQKIDKKQRFFDEETGLVSMLPGTKVEIIQISEKAAQSKINCRVYLEDEASEENLKQLQSPDILHIATHGFFIADVTKKEGKFYDNPLLRSGLLLAGAELTLKKEATNSKENGILTAQEAMNLDLVGTDLVVLSACETGLGEVKNGEGVFGLQRALQEAGVKTVLMSLWKVDDVATQEMMRLFYEHLLLKKQEKRLAFRKAQEAMKAKYKDPYYWASFVMIGE
ncbi:MAG: CHAT domain-containing tetratricopeptide repeat protein, partial [Thermonemataceae bacterium]|nr:CHAT domain-containing tetratricopeptide repeat protein [Thermonemataceae bacterium]